MLEKLIEAVVDMKEPQALELTRQLMEGGEDPLVLLNACSRAMEIVGKRFETGEYFLPHLMMGGEMLRRISEMLKPELKGGIPSERRGRVLIGTVRGDIHDIGKDIVVFMLEVNGFEVMDLGVDVPPDRFAEAAGEFHPGVIGLSGFLTLAFDAMKETIEVIVAEGLRKRVKIMIGGGQVDDEVRKYTGADAYGRDAMAAVHLSRGWTGGGA
jgi:methanogenic corrinoid protein MtbC1